VNHFRLLSPNKLIQAKFHREAQSGVRPEYAAISGEGAFSENIHKCKPREKQPRRHNPQKKILI
jgi:hypothetical protein